MGSDGIVARRARRRLRRHRYEPAVHGAAPLQRRPSDGALPVRVYGALSLIFWALMLIVTLKYVLLILRVDNHGEGGIMALVALIERVVKTRGKTGLVIVGVLGASLFYGDGMLTPAISVVGRLGPPGGVARPGVPDRAVLARDPDRPVRAPAVRHRRRGRAVWPDHGGVVPGPRRPGREGGRGASRHHPGALADLRRGSSSPTTRRWGSSPSDPSSSR